ncbi:methylated-DNA--[protein]-cysteine S-methyltransferase [Nesterenkonia alkaliphila]|uniref:Methylated-DNA--[protein]-cysteine S-methyltransferase n=1 Tax=Nesterenkonia alkaliphila TaxID=1463631 RepID=A0A7K1UI61_9MICC|nr:methylated-DNA--[protein]-cysteine S-methyltransferase [Nesterenkonia alkaliphila]MVT26165.1 methylated-DNA--[protein]-cysteine S-methyltransferase [Nesterenkonia alkaliphila]GFZ84187.1 putative methylated-DNA:protein-cysteine methyltransferase [Nesterenkonia alkaliphila]
MHTTVTTPDGPFTIIGDAHHVLASGWTEDEASLRGLIHPQLRAQAEKEDYDDALLTRAAQAVHAYYSGDTASIAEVPVRQRSGPYRERAWEVLRQVQPGAPVTYAEYAQRTGSPGAVRAAAGACAQNAAALFVPCHRVIRTDGTLGGFRYGLGIKASLLEREAPTG